MTDNGKAIFNLTRFQILQAKLNSNSERQIPDYYVYCWEEGVYPYFDEYPLHVELKHHFEVSEKMIGEIASYSDEEWRAGRLYTFYQYERYFDERANKKFKGLTREVLNKVFRLFYLQGYYDERFWSKLLEPTEYPSGSNLIISKYELRRII